MLAGEGCGRAVRAWRGSVSWDPGLWVTDSGQVDVFGCGVQAGGDLAAGQSCLDEVPELLWENVVGVRTRPGDGVDRVEWRFPGDGFVDVQTPQEGLGLLVQMRGQLRGKVEDERGAVLAVEFRGQCQRLRVVVGVAAGEQLDQV